MKRFLAGLLFAGAICAQIPSPSPTVPQREKPFMDPLLDNLVGDWHVARKFGSGRTAENTVHAEWVLGHQFLELHYRDAETPPTYEAMVFIGFDNKLHRYVMHWIDVYGGTRSQTLGTGTLDEIAHTIYFQFNYPEAQFMNAYAYDPASKTWTSVMRQKSKGPWTLFAEDKFTRR